MRNSKSTKQALLMSMMALLLCVSMLTGSTFAWFSDSVTSTANVITAGNLDVELEYLNNGTWTPVGPATNVFKQNTNWEPGHTEVVYLRVSNKGTLALKYELGVRVSHETPSTNVAGEEFKLSDIIQVGVINDRQTAFGSRADALAAVTSSKSLSSGHTKTGDLNPGAEPQYVALVVYIPESVGNEANHATGVAAPEILLGINLYATQKVSEEDSFGSDYDDLSKLPLVGTGSAPVEDNDAYLTIDARDMTDGSAPKLASFTIPTAALADETENVSVKVEKTTLNQNITVAADDEAVTFDVTVTGLKDNNDKDITVQLRIGENRSNIKLYHYTTEITDFYYDGEYVTFKTKNFSPFSVVYDAVYVPPVISDTDVPDAELRTFTEEELTAVNATNADWMFITLADSKPVVQGQTMAAAYEFTAPHDSSNIDACAYKDWYCDFFVKIELADGSELAELPAGLMYLGGKYGSYSWIGFTNPTVPVDEFIPMLWSVANPWTYGDIATNVGTFYCGVNRAAGLDAEDAKILNGATFTVQLRLVDPSVENPLTLTEDKYLVVETQTYTFPTVVTTGEGLQDAINNGSTNIELGGDIDLSQGIVIP